MKTLYLLALLAGLVAVTGCERQAEQAPQQAAIEAPETVSVTKLPITTASDEARKYYTAGWDAFDMARNNAANKQFEQAVAADPSFAIGHLMVALSATSTEEFASNLAKAADNAASASDGERLLIEAFQKAFASDQQGQLAAGQALTEMHPDAPRAWQFLAGFQANENDTMGSRKSLGKALDLDPNSAAAHMQLGNNYMFLEPKDFDKAETHFRNAADLAPDEPNPHDLLGDVHRAQGNLEAAYTDYSRADELAPELGSALQQRGHVNSFLGNYDEAREDYTRSAELENARGSNAGPFFLVFRAYVSLHEGKPEAAISELREIAADADASEMEGKVDLQINAITNIVLIATHFGDAETASAAIADSAALMRQQAEEVGTDEFRSAQEANITYLEGMLAARNGDAEGAQAKADEFKSHVESNTNPRKLERMHEIQGMADFYQEDYAGAVAHLSSGDVVNNMLIKYHLAIANANAGNTDEADRLFAELAVWNFNGPGYAMSRGDILARVSSE